MPHLPFTAAPVAAMPPAPSPFLHQPRTPQMPAFSSPGRAGTTAPIAASPSMTAPLPSPPKPKDWLDTVGQAARKLGDTARDELERYQPPALEGDPDPDTARAEVVKGSPALAAAVTQPAAWFKRQGVDVDKTTADMAEATGQKLPEDLDKDDKAALLMEMGLRIMTADPSGGLIGAIGQAGLGTMGSWREMRSRRQEAAAKAADAEREERRHRESLESRERLALAAEGGRQTRHEADIAAQAADREARLQAAQIRASGAGGPKPYSDVAKLRQDLARGLITQADFDAAMAGGGAEPTTFMRDAQYFARVTNMSEGDAARYLKLGASARGENPEKFKRDLVKALATNVRVGPEEAVPMADQIMRQLENPEVAAAAANAPEGSPSKSAWSALMDMLPGLGGSAETEALALPADRSALSEGAEYVLDRPLRDTEGNEVPAGTRVRMGPEGLEVVE